LTRDPRGYEYTFLLHASHPGEAARVLYWYRSAPGVRVGRPALDEDAIRTIEEQHPDIEFDWPHILEVGATLPPEVEKRPDRPRRRPTPREAEQPAAPVVASESDILDDPQTAVVNRVIESQPSPAPEPEPRAHTSGLLEELVGREIATRLRARFAEVVSRVHAIPDEALRATWQARANTLDPDNWVTPEEVLRGVEHADRLFDELRRDVNAILPHNRSTH
jgi:hypothetical protein